MNFDSSVIILNIHDILIKILQRSSISRLLIKKTFLIAKSSFLFHSLFQKIFNNGSWFDYCICLVGKKLWNLYICFACLKHYTSPLSCLIQTNIKAWPYFIQKIRKWFELVRGWIFKNIMFMKTRFRINIYEQFLFFVKIF